MARITSEPHWLDRYPIWLLHRAMELGRLPDVSVWQMASPSTPLGCMAQAELDRRARLEA